jgi:hypothetical protein
MASRDARLWRDLGGLRRFFWIPLLSIAIAAGVALAVGSVAGDSDEARFRVNVVVDALPPLFGPPVLPGPFDYAALATNDEVLAEVAARTGTNAEALRGRLRAEPRANSPEINLIVRGNGALAIARAWEAALGEAAAAAAPDIERRLVEPYRTQAEQARRQLEAAAAAAAASPDDTVLAQELAAAAENYKTASMLVQSYDTVAATMRARAFTVKAPYAYGGGLASAQARLGAGVVIGLLAGVLAAIAADWATRRTRAEDAIEDAPESLRRIETGTSR